MLSLAYPGHVNEFEVFWIWNYQPNNLQLSQYWYAQYKHVKATHHDFYTNQYSLLITAISITNICWA